MSDTLFVFAVLAVTIVLFASDRLRLDLVALLSLLALLLTGILTPAEALAGFADPLVLMIAGLFVVGGGIFQTGVADSIGKILGRLSGGSAVRLLVMVMLATAFLSAFLSSTGTVAVMLPVVMSLARDLRLHPSRLLIPLAFSSLVGGMLTLIGTPPNLVVSNLLRAQGLEPFDFFSFTPVGLIMLAILVLFMLLFGQRFLPQREVQANAVSSNPSSSDLAEGFGLHRTLHRLRVPANSSLAHQTVAAADLRQRYDVNVLLLEMDVPGGRRSKRADHDSIFRPDDSIYVQTEGRELERLIHDSGLVYEGVASLPRPLLIAELLLTPASELVNRSLADLRFRSRYGVTVLAAKRAGEVYTGERFRAATPRAGDTLLVAGSREEIERLRDERQNFVLLTEPEELRTPLRNTSRAPFAVIIMLGLLLLMSMGWVANVTAVISAAVAMVVTGCLKMDEAYKHINAESVVLIAAILPMATALERTGGMNLMVETLTRYLGDVGPLAMLAGIFLLTSLFSQVISNTATAVLLAPIAFQAALNLGVDPHPFLMGVAIAASTAFATPVASPVNTLVLNPGGYRFGDFLKVGVPLQLLIMLATLAVVPLLFPF